MWHENPFGELRVTDAKYPQRYIYYRPNPAHVNTLVEKGWKQPFNGIGSDAGTYINDNVALVKETCELLSLPMPEWINSVDEKGKPCQLGEYCHKIVWNI